MKDVLRLWLALLLLVCASGTWAATYNAASCSQADVSSAIGSATHGDTVTIPSCASTSWTTGITVTVGITIQGAGVGSTILEDSVAGGPLLSFNVSSPNNWRLTALTIVGTSGGGNGHITVLGSSEAWRIDHIKFDTIATFAVHMTGNTRGLIDHMECNPCEATVFWFEHCTWGGTDYGDGSWAEALTQGTASQIYVEDSTFYDSDGTFTSNVIDGVCGARVAFRYNTLTNSNGTAHGTDTSGNKRSFRSMEVYGNNYTWPDAGDSVAWLQWCRGGTCMFWGNTSYVEGGAGPGWLGAGMNMANYRDDNSVAIWGQCTGSNAFDQNASGGWKCLDAPGTGTSDDWAGTRPQSTWPNNISQPSYEWDNTFNNETPTNRISGSSNVQNNRDYYQWTGSFTGASGTGSGLRSARPATCTVRTAYWSTDQGGNWNTSNGSSNDGCLDVCEATDTWTNCSYTPYTYPHPLQNSGGSSSLKVVFRLMEWAAVGIISLLGGMYALRNLNPRGNRRGGIRGQALA